MKWLIFSTSPHFWTGAPRRPRTRTHTRPILGLRVALKTRRGDDDRATHPHLLAEPPTPGQRFGCQVTDAGDGPLGFDMETAPKPEYVEPRFAVKLTWTGAVARNQPKDISRIGLDALRSDPRLVQVYYPTSSTRVILARSRPAWSRSTRLSPPLISRWSLKAATSVCFPRSASAWFAPAALKV